MKNDEYINPDLIVNKDILKDIDVICKICKGILNNPVQCSKCENSFCKNCIENYQLNEKEKKCLFNCENAEFNKPIKINNLLVDLKFTCKKGCNDIIPYSELNNHYTKKCTKRIDYKSKYLEYKNKYEEVLKELEELKNKNKEENPLQNENEKENNNNQNNDNIDVTFKSKYHDHILKYKSLYMKDWECNFCLDSFEKKTKGGYYCDICSDYDFNICLKCKVVEKSGYIFNDLFKSKHHEHLLIENIQNKKIKCDVCNNYYSGPQNTFKCKKCDFDICKKCSKEELKTSIC